MQVLEQILQEIEKSSFEEFGHQKIISTEKATQIIRSHMEYCSECSRRKFYQAGYEDGKKDAREDDGWIPVESEEKPPTEGYIYLSFVNFFAPMVGRYEEDENGGAFYIGDEEETCISQDMIVNAWKPVDKPYRQDKS